MLLFKYCKMISKSSISKKSKDIVQMSNIIDLVMHICESISLRQVQTAAMPDNVQMMYLKIIK